MNSIIKNMVILIFGLNLITGCVHQLKTPQPKIPSTPRVLHRDNDFFSFLAGEVPREDGFTLIRYGHLELSENDKKQGCILEEKKAETKGTLYKTVCPPDFDDLLKATTETKDRIVQVNTDPMDMGYEALTHENSEHKNKVFIYKNKRPYEDKMYVFNDKGSLKFMENNVSLTRNWASLFFRKGELISINITFSPNNTSDQERGYSYNMTFKSGKLISTNWNYKKTIICQPTQKNNYCDQWQIFQHYPELGKAVLFESPKKDNNFFKAFGLNREKLLQMVPLPTTMKHLPEFQ